ncbi:hypothetical protein SAMN04515648_3454 [Phyllobacterium sp. CL33Tsu]|uniref:hypothetical protein n=1 Tax=Phyllobacterium sp. CL33Tsu TaxID=1798191 RepID=UPI0008DFF3AB|nr:hypothetical protein [Phyllobacterium sp. CL33Tsu]SFJ31768.1 hypothetical protein SAMN04515648_3454 [Phyllobacterium sp. CL33Tsu]
MKIDYDTIAALAEEIGCRRDDLVALNPANDPFYAGRPSRREGAEWFAGLWSNFNCKVGTHIRRLHYILVSQEKPVLKPNREPYLNLENDWKFLASSSLAARYLQLIPDSAMADHRNDPPIINADDPNPASPIAFLCGDTGADLNWDVNRQDILSPYYLTSGFKATQGYTVEVWVEKSTQNDILIPLANQLGFNLIPGTGETSEIRAREVVERAVADGRPMRILYVSDFDPGGRSMPVALARKVEYWIRKAELGLDITIDPIVLTPEQCEKYLLPRTPIKITETRAAKFEQRFGDGATELDALEALHPGELARIVTDEVCRYIDPTLASRVRDAEYDYQQEINAVEAEVLANYDIEAFQSRYDEAFDAFEAAVAEIEIDTEQLWPQIASELSANIPQYDLDDFPKPKSATPPEEPLFDSRRDYLDQMDHYRRWQGK